MSKYSLNQKHIFVGRAVPDVGIFYSAQESTGVVEWAVPETAQLNEKGIFLLPEIGFVAVGCIITEPEEDGNRWTKWGAEVEIVYALDPTVALRDVQLQILEWSAVQGRAPWSRSFVADAAFFSKFKNILKMSQSYSRSMELEKALD